MLEIREGSCCFPRQVVGVNVFLAFVDCILAILAFSQLIRIHSRSSQLGWTRQKVFHLLIGSSNTGYFIFFLITIMAICKGWLCWSRSCGFIFMALPKILYFAAFLLLLSFWVDLRHQADDEDCEEEDFSFHEALLEMTLDDPSSVHADSLRICLPFRSTRVGSRQKVVIWVTAVVFVLMMAFAVLMWIGMDHTFIDSSKLAMVYVDVIAIVSLLLGGALACYGLLICSKMRRVRSERASSEMWKVAGLAVVSILSFTSSAFIALFTQIPVLYCCQKLDNSGLLTSFLLFVYYFIGSSVPSALVLWIMRELPPPIVANVHEESRTIAYVTDSSTVVHNPQRWTTAASLQNQISRGSPI
ncbi:tobamovirus multiplication protein 1 isoform X3 [Ricinus communis]|uniref:tobamovirus multiplication protein 1 isoform X3 n=1 Tax=Ricinus communis TaxID=3988 RepID=UPI0007721738|nr:tobamovirus multiplication protein 1 isoform X3 [Ricinus communis]|eukprot:XP_015575020.1 tobamovirus multiplication protein 1 isoform X3 [Ricinus communis]